MMPTQLPSTSPPRRTIVDHGYDSSFVQMRLQKLPLSTPLTEYIAGSDFLQQGTAMMVQLMATRKEVAEQQRTDWARLGALSVIDTTVTDYKERSYRYLRDSTYKHVEKQDVQLREAVGERRRWFVEEMEASWRTMWAAVEEKDRMAMGTRLVLTTTSDASDTLCRKNSSRLVRRYYLKMVRFTRRMGLRRYIDSHLPTQRLLLQPTLPPGLLEQLVERYVRTWFRYTAKRVNERSLVDFGQRGVGDVVSQSVGGVSRPSSAFSKKRRMQFSVTIS